MGKEYYWPKEQTRKEEWILTKAQITSILKTFYEKS